MLARQIVTSDSEMAQASRRALEAGLRLMQQDGYQASFPESLPSIVWMLLEEAADTLARTPDPEHAFLSAGDRIGWPQVIHTAQEQYEAEVQRLVDQKMSKELPALPRLPISDPSAISRMHTVLGWLKFIRTRKPSRDKRVVLAMAMGMPTSKVRRLMGARSKNAPRMAKQRAVQHICEALQSACDCVPSVPMCPNQST